MDTKSPVDYFDGFINNPNEDLEYFNNIDWESRTTARREAFFATVTDPYTYGTGDYARTYVPRPMDTRVAEIGKLITDMLNISEFELCFLNYYANHRMQLGWHADDAESIDHTRPIAVVSFGAEREIWTKPMGGDNSTVEKLKLGNGSLMIMKPGMQHTHFHRIPKHDRECTERISLTYRGYKG